MIKNQENLPNQNINILINYLDIEDEKKEIIDKQKTIKRIPNINLESIERIFLYSVAYSSF